MQAISVKWYNSTDGWEVISDTGTSFIGGPKEIVDAMAFAVGAWYEAM